MDSINGHRLVRQGIADDDLLLMLSTPNSILSDKILAWIRSTSMRTKYVLDRYFLTPVTSEDKANAKFSVFIRRRAPVASIM